MNPNVVNILLGVMIASHLIAALWLWVLSMRCNILERQIGKLMEAELFDRIKQAYKPKKPDRYVMSASQYSQACRAWNKVHPVSPPPPPPPKKKAAQ